MEIIKVSFLLSWAAVQSAFVCTHTYMQHREKRTAGRKNPTENKLNSMQIKQWVCIFGLLNFELIIVRRKWSVHHNDRRRVWNTVARCLPLIHSAYFSNSSKSNTPDFVSLASEYRYVCGPRYRSSKSKSVTFSLHLVDCICIHKTRNKKELAACIGF